MTARARASITETDLAACREAVCKATYGGGRALARFSEDQKHDALVDALLLLHPAPEELAQRTDRQRAAGADPSRTPLANTLRNHWRNEREREARHAKIDAWFRRADADAEPDGDDGEDAS